MSQKRSDAFQRLVEDFLDEVSDIFESKVIEHLPEDWELDKEDMQYRYYLSCIMNKIGFIPVNHPDTTYIFEHLEKFAVDCADIMKRERQQKEEGDFY